MAEGLQVRSGLDSLAEYVYGSSSKSCVRRIRHLIDKHGLPVRLVARRYEWRPCWIDEYYAAPPAAERSPARDRAAPPGKAEPSSAPKAQEPRRPGRGARS